ncbi:MAG: D-alanine--D-alanine ligase [Candidatus Marinimicrobia bacterium]|nr:D-alanine--D-alanine ligase [Candidatus Neomarinimicrobiota bacterium]
MIKVGILMGGTSTEREVSLNTGKAMQTAVDALGYESVSIVLGDSIHEIIPMLKTVDVVLIALHGGDGENGVIQGMLDLMNIPYTGSNPHASSICMDKHVSKVLVEKFGVRTPKWMIINKADIATRPNFSPPYIVKPVDQGSTVGLTVVYQKTNLDTALNSAFEYSDTIMIEEYIAGREITVTILGNKAYPIVEIIPSHDLYDYECKYSLGMSQYVCPADISNDISAKIKSESEKIFSILKCRHYGRVDYRLDDDSNFWFLEINTLPGMTETSLVPKSVKAAGMSFESLIDDLINRAIRS